MKKTIITTLLIIANIAYADMINTPNELLARIKSVRKSITSVTRASNFSKKTAINAIRYHYTRRILKAKTLKQGTFETKKELKQRRISMLKKIKQEWSTAIKKIIAKHEKEKQQTIAPLLKKLFKLKQKNIFTLPTNKVKLTFYPFNREKLSFPIKVLFKIGQHSKKWQGSYSIKKFKGATRRRKGMAILQKIKTKAYKAIISYRFDLATKKSYFWSVKIVDITKNNFLLFGYGSTCFSSGNKYTGPWKDGKMEGYGIYLYKDGTKYKGNFKNDDFNGFGIMEWKNGDKYQGNWEKNTRNGYGVFTFKDGTKYYGNFNNGKFHGKGTYYFPDGTKYIGNFKNNSFNGHGIMTWKNGDKYVGNFKNGLRHGYGTYKWDDGTTWSGNWKNGKKDE